MSQSEQSLLLQRAWQERERYRTDPLSWMVDNLGVRRETIEWSINPGYENHVWDSAVRWPGAEREVPIKDPMAFLLWALGTKKFKRIGVRAGKGVSKTYLLGRIPFWFLSTYPVPAKVDKLKDKQAYGTRVFTFATRKDQLTAGLWKEVESVWPTFVENVQPEAEKQTLAIFMNSKVDSESRELWSMRGMTAGVGANEESAVKIQGIHDPNMLFIFEEMAGIEPAVVNAIRSTAVGPNNIILAVGNPTSETDELARFCDHPSTLSIRVSALDFPNVVLDDPFFIEGAVTRESIQEILDDPKVAGDTSRSFYLSNVRGITPIASGECLFSAAALESVKKHNTGMENGREVWKTQPRHTINYDGSKNIEGYLKIYFRPEDTHLGRYIIGADVSGDVDGDYHHAVVYDRVERKICAVLRLKGDGRLYGRELIRLGKMYRVPVPGKDDRFDYPVLAWEKNGVGALDRDPKFRKYPKLYMRINADSKKAAERKQLGWWTGSNTRPNMIAALRTWGHELIYNPERVPDEEFFKEMKAFVKNRNQKYEAASGFHDDAVMSLGIALAVEQEYAIKGRIPVDVKPMKERLAKPKPVVKNVVKQIWGMRPMKRSFV